jgi:hypothetical protein
MARKENWTLLHRRIQNAAEQWVHFNGQQGIITESFTEAIVQAVTEHYRECTDAIKASHPERLPPIADTFSMFGPALSVAAKTVGSSPGLQDGLANDMIPRYLRKLGEMLTEAQKSLEAK